MISDHLDKIKVTTKIVATLENALGMHGITTENRKPRPLIEIPEFNEFVAKLAQLNANN